LIWVAVAIACAGLVSGAGWSAWEARERAYNDVIVSTENLAGVLKQHSERIVDSVDMLLKVVARELGPGSDDAARQSATNAMLANLTQTLPHVVSVRLLDGLDGRTLYEFARSGSPPGYADREAQRVHVANPYLGLHVGRPFRDPETGEWLVAISSRIGGRDGIPGHVVIAHLSLATLHRFYDSLNVGTDGSITLARTDGIVLAHRPSPHTHTGRDISESVLFRQELPRSPAGHYEWTATGDGVPRIFSYRRLRDLPLVVSVGIAQADVVAAWTAEAKRDAALSAGAIVVLLIVGHGLAREVRRRDGAELALTQSEKRLRFALQAGHMVAWEIDPETRTITRSSNAQDVMGLASGHADDFLRVIHPDDRARVIQAMHRADAGEAVRLEYRHLRTDGSVHWFETRADQVSEEAGKRTITGVTFNITERRKIEEDLRVAKETAERAQAQAEGGSRAKTEFLAAMSHEIRTPLNSIMGFTDLLLDRADLAPDMRRQIGLIRTSGSALLTVINDVLDFSKIEAGAVILDPQPLSPTALVADCLSILQELASTKRLDLSCQIDPAVDSFVLGDQPRLRQILLNLLNNAVKFTAKGGVKLTVAKSIAAAGHDCLTFRVVDTGIGIAKEKQACLFQRFSQVDGSYARQYGGTGLGLAICKQLVELMGGEIGVESEAGQGSTFWFSIPYIPAENPHLAGDQPESEATQADERLRILLVEDVEINREIAEAMLQGAGHAVDVALNGAEAVEAVRSRPYDLILMDVQMPVMDGLTATRTIRRLEGAAREIPIVAMTANVYAEQVAGCLRAGMNGHIGKPFNRAELLATIARWTGRATAGAALPPAA
jgi:PAS domain S-box-containing protein